MASSLVDLVKINVSNSGTGAITLGSAVEGYRGREVLTNGTVYSYSIQQGSAWEFGRGTYLAESAQFIRSVADSSNGGAAIALKAGAQVAFTALSADLMPQVQLTEQIAADRVAAETAAGVATTAAGTATTKAGEAASSATLSGLYANADTDADIPGAAPGERGAAWYRDQAEAAVGAVKQIVPFMYQSATVLTPGAWIGEAFVPVASTYTEWVSDVDEGTAQLLVHVNDVNVLGPRTISATRDEATISVAAAKFARVTFQIGAVTGSPKRISSYLIGLPTL